MENCHWRRWVDEENNEINYEYYSGDNLVYFTITHYPRIFTITYRSDKYTDHGRIHYGDTMSYDYTLRSVKRLVEDLTLWYLLGK